MDLNATLLVTRAPEAETHGNHLRAPSIGINDLRLTAAGKSSRLHLPEGAPKPPGTRTGSDDFNFLPEHDVCDLVYDIDNPFDVIDRATLTVFKRFDQNPLWTLDLMKLGPTWTRHGKHTVKWDGRIVKGDAEIAGTINGNDTTHDLTGETPQKNPADDAPFPDGWLTLEHPPYKLRLTLESDLLADLPAVAWTYCHVMLEKIELKLGPEEAIPNDGTAPTLAMDKAVRQEIEDKGGLPASGSTREIYLLSNLFKNSSADFDPTSTKDFTTYQTLWGLGPRIPIIAKLTMRAADGSAVDVETTTKGAVAIGRAKFLWDVSDPAEVVKAVDAEAVSFLADSRQYYKNATDATRAPKDHTYWEGDNCHVDRGGARGPDAPKVFPDQAGYAPKATLDAASFPFAVTTNVKTPTKRKWAAFSHGWTSGKLKGHTGVLFRPARTAGDNYIISVQLACDWKADGTFTIDVTDKDLKVPAKITAKTGTLEVRRRLHVARYIRKTASVPDFMASNFAQVAAYYEQAFIEILDKAAAADKYEISAHKSNPADAAAMDYNALAAAALSAAGFDLYTNAVIASATENHATAPATFRVVPYADFVRNVHEKHLHHPATDFPDQATAAGVTVKQLAEGLGTAAALTAPVGANALVIARIGRINATQTYLKTQGYQNLRSFSITLEGKVKPSAKGVAIHMGAIAGCGTSGAAAPPGFTIVHFEYLHSGTKEFVDAGNPDHDGLRGAAIDVADRAPDKVVFAFWRPLVSTFAHECGHHLFLPHPMPPHYLPIANNVHDMSDTKCLMSYDPNRHGFCGFCQLRLRGWDPTKLDRDKTKNKKP